MMHMVRQVSIAALVGVRMAIVHGKLAQQAHQAGDRIKRWCPGVEEPLNNLVGIAVRCLPQVSGGEGGERRSDWDCSYEWIDN